MYYLKFSREGLPDHFKKSRKLSAKALENKKKLAKMLDRFAKWKPEFVNDA